MLPEFFEFYNPTRIIFGNNLSLDCGNEIESLGISTLGIVTDKGILGTGLVDKIKNAIAEKTGIKVPGVYSDVPENSSVKTVEAGAKLFNEWGCDGILAIGGGSVIDTGKAINILISEGGDLCEDYMGAQTLTKPLKPLVVMPTTAGTGSEVTMVAVIYKEDENLKVPFTDKFLLPALAVIDPVLTLTLPPKFTAGTGMDALTHAMEAIVGIQSSPMSDALAFEAIKLIKNNLLIAIKDGNNLEARGNMLIASTLAGIAFSHSMVGCVHGMSHTCGGLFHVPHGVANSILLPYGLLYNLEAAKEKIARIAGVWGIPDSSPILNKPDTTIMAIGLIEDIKNFQKELNAACGLPFRLRDVGIKEEDLQSIAEGTVLDGTSFYNPREVTAEDILTVLKEAY